MKECPLRLAALLSLVALARPGHAADEPPAGWVVAWVGSAQGPYPSGNDLAQPDLKLVFPAPATGAHDQSFRMIVKPEIWGCQTRLRLSNAFGSQPVRFADVFVGLHQASSAVVPGTNTPVTFAGKKLVTVAPGQSVWSDPVALSFACRSGPELLAGRKLAVSFHAPGRTGPITWHAKALQTSYLTAPGAGSRSAGEAESGFPFSTTSWYFLDALEMRVPAGAFAVVALGDSITDGTNSTLNGDDRWPDVLARRLHALHGNRVSVVNAGIGGNQVVGPRVYSLSDPMSGGPAAIARLERDVLSLSGVSAVIWLEGINDFNRTTAAPVKDVQAGFTEAVARMRARIPGLRVIGATVVTALGAVADADSYGHPEQERSRQALNRFIRTSGLFDGVADFDAAVRDPATGKLQRPYVHDTTTGGAGDGLHPNRLGYLAMAMAIDLDLLRPAVRRAPRRHRGPRPRRPGRRHRGRSPPGRRSRRAARPPAGSPPSRSPTPARHCRPR
jgi:lysophospholipase L1-like esterase